MEQMPPESDLGMGPKASAMVEVRPGMSVTQPAMSSRQLNSEPEAQETTEGMGPGEAM